MESSLNENLVFLGDVDDDAFLYDQYTVPSGDSPEDVAFYHFRNTQYHWVILITNKIQDRYYDWPMDPITFELI